MGRAIVRHPQVFLMDEPLSNLDAKLRVQTRAELADLQARLGVTTVYVTHDQVEAMTMGHRVAILDYGVMQQVDTPGELYRHPTNLFVAGFIGSPAMNLLPTRLDGDAVVLGSSTIELDPAVARLVAAGSGTDLTLGVRPQGLSLGATGIPATVVVVEELGSETFVFAELQHLDQTTRVRVRVDADYRVARGDNTHIEVLGPVHLFGADGERMRTAAEQQA
jgi:multiple sugar transport system ATP-binding protein